MRDGFIEEFPFLVGAASIIAVILAVTAPLIEWVADPGPGLHPYTWSAIILAPPLIIAGRLPGLWAEGVVIAAAFADMAVLAVTSPETVPGGLVRPAAILPLWILALLVPRPWIAAAAGLLSIGWTVGASWGMEGLASAIISQSAGAGMAVAICYGGRRGRHAIAQRAHLQAEVGRRDIERQAVARFVRHAAHELRTPLTPLRLMASSLRASGHDAATRERSLQQMDRQVSRLASIVDRLTLLASIGSHAPERQDLVAAVRTAARDEALTLPPQAWVMAPAGGVAVIVHELLDNARRAATGMEHVDVQVAEDAEGDHWVITVDDDGPGLPDAALESLHEPFGRVVLPSHPGERSGLGLPMVDAITSAAGGSLRLGPSARGGLRAAVDLPRARAE